MNIRNIEPEMVELELREIDFTLTGGQTLSITLRPEDERTDFTDAVRVRHARTGEVVLVYRQHILYLSERTRTVREKKPVYSRFLHQFAIGMKGICTENWGRRPTSAHSCDE